MLTFQLMPAKDKVKFLSKYKTSIRTEILLTVLVHSLQFGDVIEYVCIESEYQLHISVPFFIKEVLSVSLF